MNRELPDVQAGFRKGRGTRDQIANIRLVIEKAREFHLPLQPSSESHHCWAYLLLLNATVSQDCVLEALLSLNMIPSDLIQTHGFNS